MQQPVAVVRHRHHRRGRRAIDRLVDYDRRWTECDDGCRRLSDERDQLRTADRVVGNHHTAGMTAGRARLERDLEGTADARLQTRLGAGVLRRIEVEVVSISGQVDGAHHE